MNKWARVGLIAVLSLVGLAFIGGGTVLASNSAKPGDLLYPVDIATERVLLSMTKNEQRRLEMNMNFYDERLDEVEKIRRTVKEGEDSEKVRGFDVAIDNIARHQASVGQLYEKLYEKYVAGEISAERWEKFERRFYALQEKANQRVENLKRLDADIQERIEERRDRVNDTLMERKGKRTRIIDEVKERVKEMGESNTNRNPVEEKLEESGSNRVSPTDEEDAPDAVPSERGR